ncbi:MAG: UDP-N-acetylmuramoyl-tripeptide--D-alanyl-D-alanine ligase [Nitrospirae bacterium]|nr:UDP-N-acetylmuramoyl-tripeptide--D-alanyl-D-alanine ligase [Nitrospirota bacterium]
MAMLTVDDIIEATGGRLISGGTGSFTGASIDSRTINKGELFFALKGPKFDGHDFLPDVVLKGAGGAVVDRNTRFKIQDLSDLPTGLAGGRQNPRFTIIAVEDTLKALQDSAHFLRIRRDLPVIAVTGSNGKTTTKEMIYRILSSRYRVLKNEGNLNNHIGVPLSFMKIEPDDEAAVLEFGMNAPGEIRQLCEMMTPAYGVITNIGPAHIGRLGSLEAVRSAKLEILDGIQTAVLNADDDFLMQGVKGFKGRMVTFSINNDAHVRAENVAVQDTGSRFTLAIRENARVKVHLHTHGVFNIYNALAASAVCYSLGMTAGEIKTALEKYRAFSSRFEVIKSGGVTLINDSYNANPQSMKEAIKGLGSFKGGGRLVAVLGDMNELGEFSGELHRTIGGEVTAAGIDVFVAVGKMMSLAAEEGQRQRNGRKILTPEIYKFNEVSDARQGILDIIRQGDTVLVKGSRSMTMEKIVEKIRGRETEC